MQIRKCHVRSVSRFIQRLFSVLLSTLLLGGPAQFSLLTPEARASTSKRVIPVAPLAVAPLAPTPPPLPPARRASTVPLADSGGAGLDLEACYSRRAFGRGPRGPHRHGAGRWPRLD